MLDMYVTQVWLNFTIVTIGTFIVYQRHWTAPTVLSYAIPAPMSNRMLPLSGS